MYGKKYITRSGEVVRPAQTHLEGSYFKWTECTIFSTKNVSVYPPDINCNLYTICNSFSIILKTQTLVGLGLL